MQSAHDDHRYQPYASPRPGHRANIVFVEAAKAADVAGDETLSTPESFLLLAALCTLATSILIFSFI